MIAIEKERDSKSRISNKARNIVSANKGILGVLGGSVLALWAAKKLGAKGLRYMTVNSLNSNSANYDDNIDELIYKRYNKPCCN